MTKDEISKLVEVVILSPSKFLVNALRSSYSEKPQIQRDEAMRSCGISAQTIMLAAKSMGYDTCPMEGFDFEAVAKLINLPDDHIIFHDDRS